MVTKILTALFFDKAKIVLMLNKEVMRKPSAGEGSNLLSLNQFTGEISETKIVHVLIGKEGKIENSVPKIVKPLLEDFSDVFPNGLPEGIPPLRDI